MGKIVFIQTGGTIDKDYPHITKGWAFEFGEPATRRIIERLNPAFEYEIVTAFQKDSLEIDAKDRQKLTKLIQENAANQFIITHGTDTMIETAIYLAHHCSDQLIILTGAMRPERFSNSDAPINVGSAIGAIAVLSKGVYVAMHGTIKRHDEIKRNTETGQFY